MIKGVGIDMIETERVEAKIAKESGFREMVFSKSEIDYCETKANKYEHYAARFAAKEAFFKALGTGWKNGTSFNEIEITNDESGKPEIRLSGETAKTIETLIIGKISVSLSHLKDIAAAVVIIESPLPTSP
ncbi:MAG: holo-ACP synthase [Chitinophagaceae bacterium]